MSDRQTRDNRLHQLMLMLMLMITIDPERLRPDPDGYPKGWLILEG
jgi:hypothetical protein